MDYHGSLLVYVERGHSKKTTKKLLVLHINIT